MRMELTISLSCFKCLNLIAEKIKKFPAVESVSVDLKGKKATINTRSVIDKATFVAVLEDTKYSVVE